MVSRGIKYVTTKGVIRAPNSTQFNWERRTSELSSVEKFWTFLEPVELILSLWSLLKFTTSIIIYRYYPRDVTCRAYSNMATEEAMVIACSSLVFCARDVLARNTKSESTQCGYETLWQKHFSTHVDTFDTRLVVHNKSSWVRMHELACRIVSSQVEFGLGPMWVNRIRLRIAIRL